MIGQAEYREHESIEPTSLVQYPARAAGNGDTDIHRVGAWRWGIVHRNADKILQLIVGRYCIDFGGAAGPIGYGAKIVDRLADDRSLFDLPGQCDTVFTSHTLEHIVDVELAIGMIQMKLKPGGYLVAVVPSYNVEHLRAERWARHAQTFRLSTSQQNGDGWLSLDSLVVDGGFDVVCSEEDGEHILVIGRCRDGLL